MNIEKGLDDVIVLSPERTADLELFAEDLDGTLASSYGTIEFYMQELVSTEIKKYYSTLYSAIKDCNIIIGEMEDTESETAKTLLGTAWSIRSICYYNLMIRYCEPYQLQIASETLGLPLVDEFDIEAKPSRSTLKETADFILKGFQHALSYNSTDKNYIFTAPITKAYMARFFFWTQDWNNAIIYAKEVLDKYPMLEADEYVNAINQKLEPTKNVIIRSYTNENDVASMGYLTAQTNVQKRLYAKT